ncbi:aminopeptidase N [Psychrobacter phenylpyruvicus]|uniref:Aminopeptidase N n=1 Tax=Psychrobacter phenylpyruvicus TaxID=29432 RepID=A0A379LKM7_9GAMM|nr:aminopeptidase N [Psychrobacter phenylpyruvicus]SUD91113.1 Aminopeptidase N [Psychrobacter phenylpyruvicus]
MTDLINTDAKDNVMIVDSMTPDAPEPHPEAQQTTVDDGIKKIYLKDYTPPSYSVEKVELDIKLFEDHATVDSVLTMKRQHPGDLVLLGQNMDLTAISINDKALAEGDYQLDESQLTIADAPDDAVVKISVRHQPQKNTELEGLYIAGEGDEAMFVTQCEPEGFRKITYYPDRPDVLSVFTTRLEADKKFPTLLANGDLIDSGEVEGDSNRHYAIWHDVSKKPSYLFACVFADLAVLEDSYTTIEGREVKLQIYAKAYDIDKCHVAMQALKDSMHWDEVNYGRAYDLDRYMIVAVSQFNMGAMENKGLNIFNTSCVLSSPETTTDARSFSVKSIIAHEYFHNWTGNRVTCRDWFQLCLKEGLTVYRDQSFSADHQSPAVQRIDDVSMLRAHQFTEDAGPLAHPPRPSSFVEINNFYTTTVYEKGAEVVRMLANTLGEEYRQGTDTYFERYDGQAVTVEDWLSALSAHGKSVEHFIDWYTQPGTPEVSGHQSFELDENNVGKLTVTLSQKTRQVDGYAAPKALPIPVATALFDRSSGELIEERLLMLEQETQDFVFDNVSTVDGIEPIVSVLRDFSAPVQMKYQYSETDLAFLLAHETNGFNQWQSAQALVNKILLQNNEPDVYLQVVKKAFLSLVEEDAMLAARILDIPAERELASAVNSDYQPSVMKQKRDLLKTNLTQYMANDWQRVYQQLPIEEYEDTPQARGKRALRNVVLDMALTAGIEEAHDWAYEQYQSASCMTERLGALSAMVNHEHPKKQEVLDDFYQRFNKEALVMDLWFSVQAGDETASVADIAALIERKDFDWGTPNRIRAVVGSFAAQPTKLWTKEGLQTYIAVVQKLDETNPVLASRLLQTLSRWYTLAEPVRAEAKQQLQQLSKHVKSKNVTESLHTMLKAG